MNPAPLRILLRGLGGLLLLAALLPALGHAHPAVSVVMDSRGVVYYSDLENVWMIRPDGTKALAVEGVHTHALWIDAEDALYGEDVANVGEAYRHRVWKRTPGGALTDVLPWREGHPVDYGDYGFVRDGQGRSYVLRHAERRLDVRADGRLLRSISLGGLGGFIHGATRGPDGALFVGVGAAVYRIAPGGAAPVRLAEDLAERTLRFFFVHDRHALMGLWTNAAGHVYVAVFAGQVVKKITPEGAVTTVYRAEGAWSPSGGLVAPDGALWILEFSASNRARVRRIGPDGEPRTF